MGQAMTAVKGLSIIGSFFQRRPQKNFLMNLWGEVNRNFERYYVIEQRQFITEPFDVEAWEDAAIFSDCHFPRELKDYAAAIQGFNRALKEVKDFEDVYSSSIEHKTRANAEILHAKKEFLQDQFNDIRQKITAAQASLRSILDR
jgi:hypothetical protein